jgi:hypothetical protein
MVGTSALLVQYMGWDERNISWEETHDLGGIDERKGRTGLGEREGERPSAGLVSVYVAVDE